MGAWTVREKRTGNLVLSRERCELCGACIAACPEGSLVLAERELLIDHETCSLCRRCALVCPVEALGVS